MNSSFTKPGYKIFTAFVAVMLVVAALPMQPAQARWDSGAGTGPGGVGTTDGSSNLELWLTGGTGAFTDTTCTTAAGTGNSVACWTDQSGNAINFTQGTAGNRPTFGTSSLNGVNVIRFDGGTDFLNGGNVLDLTQLSVFTVVIPRNVVTPGGNQRIVTRGFDGANTQWELGASDTGTPATNDLSFLAYPSAGATSTSLLSNGTAITGGGSYGAGGWRLWFNGQVQGTTANAAPASNARSAVVGAVSTGGTYAAPTVTQRWNGDIGEVIVFSGQVNSAQRNLVNNYLSAKYNINMLANDLYTGNGAGYYLDVAGIGQEADGGNIIARSAGLVLQPSGGSLGNAEYVLGGYASATNGTVVTDLPTGIDSRWTRDWYVDKTGGVDVTMSFDFSEGGFVGDPSGGYVLLYRNTTSGNYSVVPIAATIAGNRVEFIVPDASLLDGYYTLGVDNTVPEMDVQGNATSIVDGDASPSVTDNTDFGSVAVGGNTTVTYTILNTGTGPLTVGAISFSGANPGDFSVTLAPTTPVAAAGSTTFQVQFTPGAIGLRTADINIVNNDSNENPYNFSIQGTGIIAPEMDVQGNATSIVDGDPTPALGDNTDFGNVLVGSNTTVTYTIFNTGNLVLNLGVISFSGVNAADFSVTAPPAPSVAASGSTTFDVRFTPGAAGLRSAAISIINDDSNENPYDFSIQGTGGTSATTATIIADTPDPSDLNQNVNVTVTVTGGSTTPTGAVDLTGADTNCTITLSGGTGSCNVNFTSLGAKVITATYNGDATHGTSVDTEDHDVANLPPKVTANGVNTSTDTGNGILTEFEVVTVGVNQLIVTFDQNVYNPSGNSDPSDATYSANYMLLNDNGNGFEDTPPITCANFTTVHPNGGDDFKIAIDSVAPDTGDSPGPYTLSVNGALPLSNGNYRLYVCGTTSITDLSGVELAGDGTTAGTDFIRNFIVSISGGGGGNNNGSRGNKSDAKTIGNLLIPVTGFAPNRVTLLPIQPADKAYKPLDEIRIEIPTLGINFPIVGVSLSKNKWDLTWLNGKVGYLEGSAYPTFSGNTVLTAHVFDANNNLGPFSDIKGMRSGDKIYLHAYGQVYVYQVQENRKLSPASISSVFKHEDYDWVTLVTCEDYNVKAKTYNYRRMVRAVLVSVIPEK